MAAENTFKQQLGQQTALIFSTQSAIYSVIRSYLSNIQEYINKGTIYEQGSFISEHTSWNIGLVLTTPGNATAAYEAERAITYFRPDIVLSVGIAQGIQEVVPGDIVVATHVYGYESGKVQGNSFFTRPTIGNSSYRLIQRAMAESRKNDWQQRLQGATATPSIHIGPIAAGEKIIADTQTEIFTLLHTHFNDTLAIEMEGRGFLQATQSNEEVQALIIRGIAECIDQVVENYTIRKEREQEAAKHASAFAFELLAKLDDSQPERKEITAQPVFPERLNTSQLSTQLERQYTIQAPTSDKGFSLFISYVEEDEKLAQQLQKQLWILEQRDLITHWHSGMIMPGQHTEAEILKHLYTSHIILPLISPDFMNAKNMNSIQVKHILKTMAAQAATVVPILLRPSAQWQSGPFGSRHTLPRNQKPITLWQNRDLAFAQIVDDLAALLESLSSPAS